MKVKRHTRLTGEARDRVRVKVAAMYRDGMSIRGIAGVTGRSYGAVHRLLEEAGVEMRSRGGGGRRRSA